MKRPSRADRRKALDAFIMPVESDALPEADALAARGSEATGPDDLEHVGDRPAPSGALEALAARHPSEGRERAAD